MLHVRLRGLGLTAHVFAILTATVKAGEFLQPWTAGAVKDYSDNTDYAVGVNIITEWVADFTNATITLNQDNNPGDAQGGPSVLLQDSYNKTTFGWTVSYEGMDPAYNNVFYFSVAQANGSDAFTGHYFNISDASTKTTSSATATRSTASDTSLSTASSITTASSTTPASSGLVTPQSTSPATITVVPSNDGGTPVGTIAGMVVGIVVGSLLLVGCAWWAWRIKKRRNTASRAQPPNDVSGQPYFYEEQKPYEADGDQTYEMHESAGGPIYELHESGGRPIHEMYGSVGQPRN